MEEKLKDVTDKLEQGIKDLFESGKYTDYLKAMAKFHDYSFSNALLIMLQMPEATLVAGYTAWKTKFKRQVMKGAKGIKIIAPCPYKVTLEAEKVDPNTKRPINGVDGKPITDTVEMVKQYFKVVTVFDISQTTGEPIPSLGTDELTGNVENYEKLFTALQEISPVPIRIERITTGAKGYYRQDEKDIIVNEDMSEIQTVKTTIHEISHAKLHAVTVKKPKDEQQTKDKRTREVEAESIAYIVCQYFGIDTSEYSFGYIAGWSSGKELTELKSSLELIRSTANEIITGLLEVKQTSYAQAV